MITRNNIGRALCVALGVLFTAGVVPLFTLGPLGDQIWAVVGELTNAVANALGVPAILARWLVGSFAIGGPLAIVWFIAGNGIHRRLWFLAGVMAYGVWHVFGT